MHGRIEIRYSSEYYGRPLYGVYSTLEEAQVALLEAKRVAYAAGQPRLAESFAIC